MKKIMKQILVCCIVAVLCWCGMLIWDKNRMKEDLIRLHVVADSNDSADQVLKLHVRDAILKSLEANLRNVSDVGQAKQYIETRLPHILAIAEDTLKSMGCTKTVEVHFGAEAFDTSYSDTHVLPAGIYNALRIVIGNGGGKNWWGIIFPDTISLAAVQDTQEITAGSFGDEMTKVLFSDREYNLRFGILEIIGKLEKMLFADEYLSCSLD